MDKLYDLKEKLLKELESYADKPIASGSALDIVKKLSSTVDHLCNIVKECEEEEGGYSGRMSYARDPMGRDVEPGRDMSYRASYARRRDSMGRYSGEMGYSRHGDVADQIRELIDQAPDEQTRRELERIAQKMERS
jgi:hypothetical protein